MTAPRQIIAGRTYLVTRRCTQRRFLLRPSPIVNKIISYCLAVAAQRYGVRLHVVMFLSNHYHLVLTDVRGELPKFMEWLNRHIARALNATMGRWENLFDNSKYSCVHLADEGAVWARLGYTLVNPVAAGLVPRVGKWPGVWTHINAIGAAGRTIDRPRQFFRTDGDLPDQVLLDFTQPPCFGAMSTTEFRRRLKEVVGAAQQAAVDHVLGQGRTFLGERGVLRQDPESSPTTKAPRRQRNPRIACRDKKTRIAAIKALQQFERCYRAARTAWRDGDLAAVFPAGTYWLRRLLRRPPIRAAAARVALP
jgi:REP element-mobilizing transposase RayT